MLCRTVDPETVEDGEVRSKSDDTYDEVEEDEESED
jgi:hypothetical protein